MELAVKPRDVHKAWDRCCSPVGARVCHSPESCSATRHGLTEKAHSHLVWASLYKSVFFAFMAHDSAVPLDPSVDLQLSEKTAPCLQPGIPDRRGQGVGL